MTPARRGCRRGAGCRVTQIVPVDGTTDTMILGRIVCFHIRDDLLRADGTVDAKLLKPVGRLNGDEYAKLGDIFKDDSPRGLERISCRFR